MTSEQRKLLEQFAAGETDDTGWAVNDAVNAALKDLAAARIELDRWRGAAEGHDRADRLADVAVKVATRQRDAARAEADRLRAAAKYYQSCADDGLLDEDERKHAAAIHAAERAALHVVE